MAAMVAYLLLEGGTWEMGVRGWSTCEGGWSTWEMCWSRERGVQDPMHRTAHTSKQENEVSNGTSVRISRHDVYLWMCAQDGE